MPEHTEAWGRFFPDYPLETWTESSLIQLGMPAPFFAGRTYAERSDVARYVVLHRFGGLYADCDVLPLSRFDHLWSPSDSLICFQESEDLIWNGLFASSPGNPALNLITKLAIRSAQRHDAGAAPNVRTGPFVFTAGVDYHRAIDPAGTRIYPVGFAHVRDPRREFAVASSPFRDPPFWAEAPRSHTGPSPQVGDSLRTGLQDAGFALRYAPLRVRRKLRNVL